MRQWAGRADAQGQARGRAGFRPAAARLGGQITRAGTRHAARPGAQDSGPRGPATGGAAEQPDARAREMTLAQERAAMAAGLANLQEAQSAWTRYDLIRSIGEALPDHVVGADQDSAWRHLERLADRCLAGEAGEEVVRLSAPEWPPVPESLRRADGESIYRPHGAEQYATRAHLSMEEQLVADAQEQAAPRIEPGRVRETPGRRPRATRITAPRGRAGARRANRHRAAARPGNGRVPRADQPAPGRAHRRPGGHRQDLHAGAASPPHGNKPASARYTGWPPPQPAATFSPPPGPASATTPQSSSATCPASGKPAARSTSASTRCCSSTRPP